MNLYFERKPPFFASWNVLPNARDSMSLLEVLVIVTLAVRGISVRSYGRVRDWTRKMFWWEVRLLTCY